MSQPKRLGALNKFKAGERSILVATDVASRGLDIPRCDFAATGFPLPANIGLYNYVYLIVYNRIRIQGVRGAEGQDTGSLYKLSSLL
jgi:hypothetical protein